MAQKEFVLYYAIKNICQTKPYTYLANLENVLAYAKGSMDKNFDEMFNKFSNTYKALEDVEDKEIIKALENLENNQIIGHTANEIYFIKQTSTDRFLLGYKGFERKRGE